MKIILASQSPRRRELMNLLKKPYEVIPSQIDEILEEGLTIEEKVKSLAYQKAESVIQKVEENCIVIGADTIVVKDNKIYGKPKDKEDAISILKQLQGQTHQVLTGLCVLRKEGKNKISKHIICETTDVTIEPMTDQEIMSWINSGKAEDKAGAYAIQEEFAIHISKINGNYSSVIGLPINKLNCILKNM